MHKHDDYVHTTTSEVRDSHAMLKFIRNNLAHTTVEFPEVFLGRLEVNSG